MTGATGGKVEVSRATEAGCGSRQRAGAEGSGFLTTNTVVVTEPSPIALPLATSQDLPGDRRQVWDAGRSEKLLQFFQ